MAKKQEYELLRLELFRLSADDIVTASSTWNDDSSNGGESGGTDLPPDFEE